jgi:hypothetical protein
MLPANLIFKVWAQAEDSTINVAATAKTIQQTIAFFIFLLLSDFKRVN